jgi:DNA-binding beta-propeller fold protein YncE
VYALGVTQDGQLNTLAGINLAMTPLQPLGMTPSALALSKDGSQLFVVCSDANVVAALDISGARARILGYVPTGWYPTAVRAFDDGSLAILNGKGLGSRANPHGPTPFRQRSPEYIPRMQTGTVSFTEQLTPDRLSTMTATALSNSPYRDELLTQPISDQQQSYFASVEQHPSPIRHVIYIIKENRTYDQILGDLGKGNGDNSLTLFGENVTPNLHKLARDFITYDNFYENADVSAEGHNWANAAIAPDYTVKTWPSNYANRKKGYDYEGGEPANTPPAGYIWSNAVQAGLTVRDYGEWTENVAPAGGPGQLQIAKILDPTLRGQVDMDYRGWDLQYPDVNRAHEFIREWSEFDQKGSAPNLLVVRLGNDHTSGTKAGALTPTSYAADNDYAVGLVAEAVSHSHLWNSTAIFVIEDDAQNGPDHVDSHRAPAWVISPFTHRGLVDSTMYNQMSVLRTIEMIMGLRPMTQFDAAATPMFSGFSKGANVEPFTSIPPRISTTDRNPANGPGSQDSARMDFSAPDQVDDTLLNAVLWRSQKGSDPPPNTQSAFAR